MAQIIGIDLGTTNSAVAVMEAGEPTIISSPDNDRIYLTPSVVSITKTDERLIGHPARRNMGNNPENTIFSVKRFMGRKSDDEEVQEAAKRMPYEVGEAPNGDVRVKLNGRAYSPPEISAWVLQKLKANAEAYLEETVDQAVITVPAHFDDAQRKATIDAGKIAGLDVLRIINEPTAAALLYGFDKRNDGTIAVYDMGGGTFDISILKIANGIFEVQSTNGDTFLGGDNFDERIVNWIAEQFEEEHGIDLRTDPDTLWRLKQAAEEAKIELSETVTADIYLTHIPTADDRGLKNLSLSLSRAKLESLVMDDVDDLIQKSIDCCQQALEDAELSIDDINAVLLVGGMSRMPVIREAVENFFGKEPTKKVNPDEVVALGAAIQAGVLDGDVKDIVLVDVTSLTLSIETKGDIATPMIKRNTTIPTKVTKNFTTVVDNQTEIMTRVVQGERPMASDNTTLGEYVLDGILPAPRGVPKIEDTFAIDANGILHVSTKDLATGREKGMTIIPFSGLSGEEIVRAKAEAEQHAKADAERKERAEASNQAESTVYQAEKLLRNYANKLSPEAVRQTRLKIDAARQVQTKGDIDQIKTATEALTQQLQTLGAQMYKDAASST